MTFSRSILFICVTTMMHSALANVETKSGKKLEQATSTQVTEPSIQVNEVVFSGNTIYTEQLLKGFVAQDLGQVMTLAQIKELALKVQNIYQQAGYNLTKVVVPQQNFQSGQPVQLLVLEGKLGKIEYTGNSKYYDTKFITQSLSASDIVSGRAFTLGQLENTLARINRQAGVKVASVLKPGAEQGSTDISIQVDEAPRFIAAVEVNNYGSKSTGEYRALPYLDIVNLTGRGDDLSFMGMHSIDGEGSYFARLAYNTPINASGTKAAAYVYKGNVRVGEQLTVLNIQGDNSGYGLGLQHDFVKDARNLFQLESWFESYDLKQTMLDEAYANDKVRKLRLVGNFERLGENNRSLYSVSLHQGLGDTLGAMPKDSNLSTRSMAGADNSFTKLGFDWTRIQRITPRFSLLPHLTAQYAFNSLVSGEQIAIGGYNSVIGQAPSAYSGDSGFNLNLEGRYVLFPENEKYQLSSRIDYGQVFTKKVSLDQDRNNELTGMSVGLLANPTKNISLRLDYGHALDKATGKENYAYFQARYTY